MPNLPTVMEIATSGAITRILFADRASAETELAALAPKIGLDPLRFASNRQDDGNHTVKNPTGDTVVAVYQVHTVQILDYEASKSLQDILWAESNVREVERAGLIARAKATAVASP